MVNYLPDTINVTGMASQKEYEQFLSTVQYHSSADEQTPVNEISNRSILFQIWDYSGDILKAKFVAEATATVLILPVNDAPQINTAGSVDFYEATRMPVNLFSINDTIDDSDNEDLLWVTVQLHPALDSQDKLSVPNVDGLTISREKILEAPPGSCMPAHELYQDQFINISGLASKTTYEDVLHNVTFNNDCPDLRNNTRTILVHLYDGSHTGTTVVNVSIWSVDDPPLCFFGYWPVSIPLFYFYCK